MLSSRFKTINPLETEPERPLTNKRYSYTTFPLYLNKKDKGHMENVTYWDDRPDKLINEGQIQSWTVTHGSYNQVCITGYPY